MSLIDLAAPYINIRNVTRNKEDVSIDWKIGGAVTVDSN
jgi:hypothetical protein